MSLLKKRYSKIILSILMILIALITVDYLIGYKQERFLEERATMKKKLQQLAWYTLRSEIKDILYSGDKYKIILKYENPFPETDLYIMIPTIRCFVQVGTLWKEVPVHDIKSDIEAGVIKLGEPLIIEKLLEVPFRNFEELLPGYMHVRINSVTYVASEAISKEEIAEKNEDFYIYLKPYYADDREIAKKYKFTSGIIPVWIPMPPH